MRRLRTTETATLVEWGLIGTEPLADNDGEDDTFSGFRERELRVLQRTNVKLARMLSRNKTKFRLFFAIDESVSSALDYDLDEGLVTYGSMQRALTEFGVPAHRLPKEDRSAVNVIFRGLGDGFNQRDNLPPTPWIVIHWIAHGVMKTGTAADSAASYNAVQDTLTDAISSLYGIYTPRGNEGINIKDDAGRDFMHSAFTFRSARKRMLRSWWEGIHELFAEWLSTGSVRWKTPAQEIGRKPNKGFLCCEPRDEYIGEIMDDMVKKLGRAFENVLADAKGSWYVV